MMLVKPLRNCLQVSVCISFFFSTSLNSCALIRRETFKGRNENDLSMDRKRLVCVTHYEKDMPIDKRSNWLVGVVHYEKGMPIDKRSNSLVCVVCWTYWKMLVKSNKYYSLKVHPFQYLKLLENIIHSLLCTTVSGKIRTIHTWRCA